MTFEQWADWMLWEELCRDEEWEERCLDQIWYEENAAVWQPVRVES